MARYLMQRLSEKYGVDVEYPCKPLGEHRTGTARACTPTSPPTYLREVGGKAYFEALMAEFEKYRKITLRSMDPTTTCG